MNKAHTHGILQTHVVLVLGSHVTLFVPAQKNDKLSQGLFVTLAWISSSGVLIGAWIQQLLSRLQECDLQRPTVPLFLPTMGNLRYQLVSPGVHVSKPQVLRKILPRIFTIFDVKPDCWLCLAGILVESMLLLTAMAMGCLWIYWRPTGAGIQCKN